jgi:hypothetical protein
MEGVAGPLLEDASVVENRRLPSREATPCHLAISEGEVSRQDDACRSQFFEEGGRRPF